MFKIKNSGKYILVKTPYNPHFVDAVKNMGGKWDNEQEEWKLRAELLAEVRKKMLQCFGRDDTPAKLVNVRVKTLDAITSDYNESIYMYGRRICGAWGRDSGVNLGESVAFIEKIGESAGSLKNWYTRIPADAVFIIFDVAENALSLPNEYDEDINVEIIPKEIVTDELMREKELLLQRISEIDILLQKNQ